MLGNFIFVDLKCVKMCCVLLAFLSIHTLKASTDEEQERACQRSFDVISIIQQQSIAGGRALPYLGEWSATPSALKTEQRCCANPPAYINLSNQKITMGDIVVYGDGSSGLYGKIVDALRNNDGEVVLIVLFVDRSKKLLLTSISGERLPDIHLADHFKMQNFENLLEDLVTQTVFSKPIMGSGFSFFSSLSQVSVKQNNQKNTYSVGEWITFKELNDGNSIHRLARIAKIFSSGIENKEIVANLMRSDGNVVSVLLSQQNIATMKKLVPQPSEHVAEELVFRTVSKSEFLSRGGLVATDNSPVFVPEKLVDGNVEPNFLVSNEKGEKGLLGTIVNLDLNLAWRESIEKPRVDHANEEWLRSTSLSGRIEVSNGANLNLFDSSVLSVVEGFDVQKLVVGEDAIVLWPKESSKISQSFPRGNLRAVELAFEDSYSNGASKLLVARHVAAVQIAKHKSNGEGNFEMWIRLHPSHMRDLGFKIEASGSLVYPDINGLNRRFERVPAFQSVAKLIKLKPKLSYIKDESAYFEYWNNSLARGEFLVSTLGSQHFRDMGVIPSLVLLPADYIADMVKAARLLEALKSSYQGASHQKAIRNSMRILRDSFYGALDLVEDVVFFGSINRVKVLDKVLNIYPIFSNKDLLGVFETEEPLTQQELKRMDLFGLFVKITGLTQEEAKRKLGLETAQGLQKIKLQLNYDTKLISDIIIERNSR